MRSEDGQPPVQRGGEECVHPALAVGCIVITERISLSLDQRALTSTLEHQALDTRGAPVEGGGNATGRAVRIGFRAPAMGVASKRQGHDMQPSTHLRSRIRATALGLVAALALLGCDRDADGGHGARRARLPSSEHPLVVRTVFSDDSSWKRVRALVERPDPVEGFTAYVRFLDDRAFEGLSRDDVLTLDVGRYRHGFLFLVDAETLQREDRALLFVELRNEHRTFRVIPSQMWVIENNLSVGNMGIEDFADSVDSTGTFRGFPAPARPE